MGLKTTLAAVLIAVFTSIALRVAAQVSNRSEVAPVRDSSQLDANGRLEAVELRKQTLTVLVPPYPATSSAVLVPVVNDDYQRRICTEYLDEVSGLTVSADTHLCLPGRDPCVSGGMVAVTDGTHEWKITFQLLGSENPSLLQSHIPKSRSLLKRLQLLAQGTDGLARDKQVYYDTLKSTLGAESDALAVQAGVNRLIRLLLASFFASEEYADTMSFAERHDLIQ
jgi:hypothetical protein